MNERLMGMLMEDLYHQLRVYRYKSSTRPGRANEAMAEHHAIVKALADRDPDAAEFAMRSHLRNARAHLEASACRRRAAGEAGKLTGSNPRRSQRTLFNLAEPCQDSRRRALQRTAAVSCAGIKHSICA